MANKAARHFLLFFLGFSIMGMETGIGAAPAAESPGPVIEVFTDSRFFPVPAATAAAAVYDLAAGERALEALSRGLPANPKAAEALAKARADASRAALRDAAAGLARAAGYGIRKIPATVFGRGEAVVYGVADPREALAMYRRWREARP